MGFASRLSDIWKNYRLTFFKALVTAVALALLVAHLIWPTLGIDAIALGLLALALVPWLAPIITSIEVPGLGKVELRQKADSEAIVLVAKEERQAPLIDPRGFYTLEGLKRLIDDSGLVAPQECVVGNLQLFKTEKQHTWLLATSRQVFCVLDDENTRSSSRMIQWRLPLAKAWPVTARLSLKRAPRKVPVVDIGEKTGWLYSLGMYHSGAELEQKINAMLAQAKQPTKQPPP